MLISGEGAARRLPVVLSGLALPLLRFGGLDRKYSLNV
jgi:hypothetical protein